jgi:hypothetical protein
MPSLFQLVEKLITSILGMALDIKNKFNYIEIVDLYQKQCQTKNVLALILPSTIVHNSGQWLPRAVLLQPSKVC